MEFIRISGPDDGVAPLLDRLTEELIADKRVVWLITGGSNIPLCAAIMREIPDELTANLTVFLTDERFGPVGHANSNERLLDEAGYDPKQASWIKVLVEGLNLEATCERYGLAAAAAFEAADMVIAQIGMGPDGHICGILPASPAVDSEKLVVGYESDPYTRITLTPQALRQYVTAAYVFTFGEARRPALDNLMHKQLSTSEQPAQTLKLVPEAYIYNDQLAGEADQ